MITCLLALWREHGGAVMGLVHAGWLRAGREGETCCGQHWRTVREIRSCAVASALPQGARVCKRCAKAAGRYLRDSAAESLKLADALERGAG